MKDKTPNNTKTWNVFTNQTNYLKYFLLNIFHVNVLQAFELVLRKNVISKIKLKNK